jgi:hypothetical protein
MTSWTAGRSSWTGSVPEIKHGDSFWPPRKSKKYCHEVQKLKNTFVTFSYADTCPLASIYKFSPCIFLPHVLKEKSTRLLGVLKIKIKYFPMTFFI